MLATLIRLLGDFDRAEEALHDAFSAAVEQWPRDGVPASPRAWLVSAGRFRAIDALRRRARFDASLAALAAELEGQTAAPGRMDRRGDARGRPAPADLHLLPPGAAARRAGGPDAARSLRPHDRGDRARVPDRAADGGAADRAGQGQDPRRPHPLPGAGARRAAGPARRRAARGLSGVQRGVLGVVGRHAHAPRSLRRSDPARTAAGGAAARAGGGGPARADAAPGVAARARGRHRRARWCCSTPRTAPSGIAR